VKGQWGMKKGDNVGRITIGKAHRGNQKNTTGKER